MKKNKNSRINAILTSVIFIALLVAVGIGIDRSSVERANDQVELTFDYQAGEELCEDIAGYDTGEFLSRLKEAGITSLAIYETTLGTLSNEAEITFITGKDIIDADRLEGVVNPLLKDMLKEGDIVPSHTYILTERKDLLPRLRDALRRRAGEDKVGIFSDGKNFALEVVGNRRELLGISLGFIGREMKLAEDKGLAIVPRIINPLHVKEDDINFIFAELDGIEPISTLIFAGSEVLGYKEFLPFISTKLRERGLRIGLIELLEKEAWQKGLGYLAGQSGQGIVRVHSILPKEMENISLSRAVARWTGAAWGRNVRLLYIRPFMSLPEGEENKDLIDFNIEYVRSTTKSIRKSGFVIEKAGIFTDLNPNLIYLIILSAGIVAAGMLLYRHLELPSNYLIILVILAVISFIALLIVGKIGWARKILALGGACFFPILALWSRERIAMESRTLPGIIGRAILILFKVSLVSLIGGLIVAALLTDTHFLLKIDQFRGVKISFIIPIIAVFLIQLYLPNRGRVGEALDEWVNRPILNRHIIWVVLIGIVAFIFISRTGNFSYIPVFDLEEKMRLFLERTLPARPRSKEFLIGHPAIMLAVAAYALKDRNYVLPLILIGLIGQTDIVNTFTHLHTPIILSLMRTFYGLIFGSLIGAILIVIYYLLRNLRKRIRKTLSFRNV